MAIPAPPGLTYFPYQRAGIEFIAAHDRTLLADEMGLGKTIQVIGTLNYRDYRRILVISPASVKINWTREIEKWSVGGLKAVWLQGRKANLTAAEDADVVVINFELLKNYEEFLRSRIWELLAVDEAHYLKSGKADRTAQVFGRKRAKETSGGVKPALSPIPFKRLVLMTGTPILNKPKELWPLLQTLDPKGLGADWFAFAKRYCQLEEIKLFDPSVGRPVHKGWIWDGADNLEELQSLMRSRFMLRRLKKDVLKELPPKTRQIIPLEAKKGLTKLLTREMMTFDEWIKKDGGETEPPPFSEMSKIRKEVAIAKIPYIIEYLKEVLEETSKIVVFIHHHDVADAIIGAFGHLAALFDGRCSSSNRQNSIDRFRDDPQCRLFVGSIQAAGVGITLTAANIAIFAECDWVPGNNIQAEDRLHRIGQKENVHIQYIVLDGSLEQRIIQANIRKQEIADKALDK